eukprot:scaffold56661_cov36-Phaeocystis_antarctica.AAC.1
MWRRVTSLCSARTKSCGSGMRSPPYSPSSPTRCSLAAWGGAALPPEASPSEPNSMGVHSPEPGVGLGS